MYLKQAQSEFFVLLFRFFDADAVSYHDKFASPIGKIQKGEHFFQKLICLQAIIL